MIRFVPKFFMGDLPVLSVETMTEYNYRGIFTDDEAFTIMLLQAYINWQIGEGSLPKGMDEKQCRDLMNSATTKFLIEKTEHWYRSIGGTKPCFIAFCAVCTRKPS